METKKQDATLSHPPIDASRDQRGVWTSGIAILIFLLLHLAFSAWSRSLGQNSSAGQGAVMIGTLVILALVWGTQRKLGRGLAEIGLARPHSWQRTIGLGIGIALLCQAVVGGTLYLILPLLGGEAPDVSRFEAVRSNLAVMVSTVLAVWITSALPEEVIWRGFLITRLAEVAGGSRRAWIGALLLSSIHFGMIHSYQGASGMLGTGVAGLVYGVAFLTCRRNLWVAIIAHAASHVIGFTLLYLGAMG